MQALSAPQLAQWLADAGRPAPLLLDVREPWEFERARIEGSLLVPMRELPARVAEIDPEREVVCICHHGSRSAQVAMFLARNGYAQLYNLTGGVDAWARQVDPKVPVY